MAALRRRTISDPIPDGPKSIPHYPYSYQEIPGGSIMKTLTRCSFVAMFLLLAFAAGSRTANAQQLATCTSVMCGNNSGCDVVVCLSTTGGVACSPFLIPGEAQPIIIP